MFNPLMYTMSSYIVSRVLLSNWYHRTLVRLCSSKNDGNPSFVASRPHPIVEKMIRVNHAGEFGATRINAGQVSCTELSNVRLTMKHMGEQKKAHLDVFTTLMHDRRVRPTVLLPLWNIAGYALGTATALLGKEAAMACTVAIEEAVVEHYNSQLRELLTTGVGDDKLLETISKCRDDEAEHKDIGIRNGAESMPAYQAFSEFLKLGCKTAIWLSERI